jgi:hypothetical protein
MSSTTTSYPYTTIWNSDWTLAQSTDGEIQNPVDGEIYYADSILNVGKTSSYSVSDGFITFSASPTTRHTYPRLYLDIHKSIGTVADSELEFYAIKNGQVLSIGTKLGNHGTKDDNGDPRYHSYLGYVFGGYGIDFHTIDIHDRWEYWHDFHADSKKIITRYGRNLPVDTLVGYKIRIENNPNGSRSKKVTVWVDFDANGVWKQIASNTISSSQFNYTNGSGPTTRFPTGYTDSNDIKNGVFMKPLHRWWIRLNPRIPKTDTATLKVTKIKVRVRR